MPLVLALAACASGPLAPEFTSPERWIPLGASRMGSIETRDALSRENISRNRSQVTMTMQMVALNHDWPWGGRVAHVEVTADCRTNAFTFNSAEGYTTGGTLVGSAARFQLQDSGTQEWVARPGSTAWNAIRRACENRLT
ncbi:hypothetical protein [Neoroseomonas rubea]|uniref:hypothetical protein n=1 Tax=Neoroseomonas rubea TaxID=2748666 RepID=UPI0018DFB71F|nr:hypothetical protein [Roseomonas rubea]